MRHGLRRRALMGVAALAAGAAFVPAAHASITPSASTSTPKPLTAGATGNLDLNVTFNNPPSGGTVNDTPKTFTINLPAGMLANAAAAGGTCLTTAQTDDGSPCQVGSGTITAYAYGTIPVPGIPVNFFLVPPPNPGDLAGLQVASAGTLVGSPGDIKIRPSGDPAGVGVQISLSLPNSQSGVPIDITNIDSQLVGLRFPATCPSTAANLTVSATSYADPTVKSAPLPLPVAGCQNLPFAPKFGISVTKDKTDNQVSLTTETSQAANESPASSLALALPQTQLKAALGGLTGLCKDPTSGTCTPVANVVATSPDYPTSLTAQGYLTGNLSGLKLTLIFPAPFPITLTGSVDLKTNTTTFTGIPDLPLTDLKVNLLGGKGGLFNPNCTNPTGTATATLVDQNGDKTVKPASRFTIAGCPGAPSGGGGGGGGGGGSSKGATVKPHVSSATFSGLKKGHPSVRFVATAGKTSGKTAKLRSMTVALPKGLSFKAHTTGKGKHKAKTVAGLKLKGAKLKSARLSKGRLVITLRSAVRKVTVSVSSKGLKESSALRKQAQAKSKKKRPKQLKLTVTAKDAAGKRTTIHVRVTKLGL